MALKINDLVGRSSFFDGNNYDYQKTRMMVHIIVMRIKLWKIVDEGYIILDPKNITRADKEN